ncbi:MAG: TetR/AcrR family transcriptional regulator [Flavobacteriaceae bacterium]
MEKILSTCAEMFLTLGFKSVTMDDIAQNLGISKKTLYTHFPNKETLVNACVFYFFDYVTGEIRKITEKTSTPIEELYEIKLFMMQLIKNEKISPQFQLKKFYPEIFEALQEKQMAFMVERMSNSLEKGVALGLFRSNLNIPFVARLYFNGMMGIKDQRLFPAELFQHSQLMADYLEYHLRAICTEKGIAIYNTIENETNA